MAADVYLALQGFYALHPHVRKRPLFITGESFAGERHTHVLWCSVCFFRADAHATGVVNRIAAGE